MVLVGISPLSAGSDFVAPAEGPVAFRRDKVPLPVESMAQLSHDLVTLADGIDAETALNRRAAAQMLALAVALDPGNGEARKLIGEFEKGGHTAAADTVALATAREKIRESLAWLKTPDAGPQGTALAACLGDILALSDPTGPQAQALAANGEQGAWGKWIPPVSAYEPPPEVANTDEPKSADPTAAAPAILLPNAQVLTPLWVKTGDEETPAWVFLPRPLEMNARILETPLEGGEPAPFSLVLGSPENAAALEPAARPILALLKKRFPALPANARISIGGKAFDAQVVSRHRPIHNAAATVLAISALTGREPEATIIGDLDANGDFVLPTGFWDQLRSLEGGAGGRLVVPAEAAKYLPSMLALEKPGFFFQYEILLAKNLDELLDYSAKVPAESVAGVLTKFREIREKSVGQQAGLFVANAFVRRRLADLAQEAPYHFSSRMLAIQGAGSRPILVPRLVLASEIRRAIEPMEWIPKWEGTEIDAAAVKQLGASYKSCDTALQALKRYAQKEDLPLFELAETAVTAIRPLERAARSRGLEYEVIAAVLPSHKALVTAHAAAARELANAIGEPVAAPEPK